MVFLVSLGSSRALLAWSASAAGLAAWLGTGFVARSSARGLLVPGATTAGHYQIELACEACHTEPFGGRESLQKACVGCHGEDLKTSKDSHPESKFTDPRNADRLAVLDARYCVTCHVEHQPRRTLSMGLTQPSDYCFHCHAEVAEERPSHQGMAFDTCTSTGCHNYHDNRALYEDFLVKHAGAPETHATELPLRPTALAHPLGTLRRQDVATFAGPSLDEGEMTAWEHSAHALARVGCADCHGEGEQFVPRPGSPQCSACHEGEVQGWLSGRHGMRAAQGLPEIQVREARLEMKGESGGRSPDCNACHSSHANDTKVAAAEACLTCHDDEHSRSHESSEHGLLWLQELNGQVPEGTGVSCATCHLPRVAGDGAVRTVHNQNDNLRPREKMLRSVCMSCHSLGFAIDALADDALVRRNFSGRPAQHVTSIDLALQRASSSR